MADRPTLSGRHRGQQAYRSSHYPHAASSLSYPGRPHRRRGIREAREPPAAGLLQDARGRQPGLPAHRLEEKGRGIIVASSGNFGQGIAYAAGDFRGRSIRSPAHRRQPGQGRVHPPAGGHAHIPRPRLRRLAGARRAAGQGGGLPVHPLGQRGPCSSRASAPTPWRSSRTSPTWT